MKHRQLENGEIYHIYNRGVDKRDIFLQDIDYIRFVHDLFVLNDVEPVVPSNVRLAVRTPFNADAILLEKCLEKCLELRTPNIQDSAGKVRRHKPRERLVDIFAFSSMPNHFHLMLRQRKEKGITKFMNKLGVGYVMYFNKKYDRSGALFEGRFKSVHVTREEYLEYLLYYIHFNCLDLIEPGWREGMIKDYSRAMKFLEQYRWSSHLDYAGKKNFPSVTQRDFMEKVIGKKGDYRATVQQWLQEISNRLKGGVRESLTLERK